MSRVVFMCGPSGSGKSTYARRLEAEGMVRLSFDAEAWRLGIRVVPFPPGVRDDIETALRARLLSLVEESADVVLDFSFWSRQMRDDYRRLLRPLGVEPETVYLATDRETVLTRVRDRRADHADDFQLDDDLAAHYFDHFEPPTPDEGPLLVVRRTPEVAEELGRRLGDLPWVTDLWVGGSVATGDYLAGISDLDLVAVVDGPVTTPRRRSLVTLHRDLDRGVGAGLALGCVYVDRHQLLHPAYRHPTWTHGRLVERTLSGVTRAELVRHGFAILGGAPGALLPAMSDDDVREAARAELLGYWAWAARRPWLWLDPVIADLGLTSMARGRHALATGHLLTKTHAVEQADAPRWLVDQLRARRTGASLVSPRLRTAFIAWRDARRTVARTSRR